MGSRRGKQLPPEWQRYNRHQNIRTNETRKAPISSYRIRQRLKIATIFIGGLSLTFVGGNGAERSARARLET